MGINKIKEFLSRITGFNTPLFGISWNSSVKEEPQGKGEQANLVAELRKKGNAHGLYLINSGEVEARNIRVMMDGKLLAEHKAAIANDPMPTLVGPNSSISCTLGIHFGCASPFYIEVVWDDDSGNDKRYRTPLTF